MWYLYLYIYLLTSLPSPLCSANPSGSSRLTRPSIVIPDLATKCFVGEGPVLPHNPQVACAPYITVGYDATDCEGDLCGKPICCPPELKHEIELDDCSWRGSNVDCHGQCVTGQVLLARSTWDESYSIGPEKENDGNCKTGSKALCCGMSFYYEMFANCYHAPGFGYPCTHNYTSIATFWDPWIPWKKGWPVYDPRRDLCCPMAAPLPFLGCRWVGEGDCLDAYCAPGEVSLGVDPFGEDGESCVGARPKTLCCTPNFAVRDKMVCRVEDFYLEDREDGEDGEDGWEEDVCEV